MQELTYEYFPEECYICHTTSEMTGLEMHHIYRGAYRKTSPTVALCNRCHRRVTDDIKADLKLRRKYERENK